VWTLISSTPLPEPPGQAPRAAITQVIDISERKRFESQLRHLADHDALTGLFNRHRFESELEQAIADVDRTGRDAGLLIIDLDGFKDVNDRFGHPVGDQLVCRIADVLRDVVRTTDVIARLGGDEFAVILPAATPAAAEVVATRILEATRERGCTTIDPHAAQITASIGVTTFEAATGLTGAELVVEADTAMYDAKTLGRDRYVIYDRALHR
jgi:diguanylate cyclase (GGDEF)-like protein